MKKARGGFARAFDAVSVNTEFLEDSVTRSQAFCRARVRLSPLACKQQEKNRERDNQVARMSEAKCGKWQSRISLTLIRAAILNEFGDLFREP